MSLYETYEIDENEVRLMKTICRVEPEDDLPEPVRRAYIDVKCAADRISAPITDDLKVLIAFRSGWLNGDAKVDEPTVVDLWNKRELKAGDKVFCTYRKKQNLPAKIVGLTGNKEPVLIIDGQVEERRIAPDNVYLQEQK